MNADEHMRMMWEVRNRLARELNDWMNAGGPVEDVIFAIEDLIEAKRVEVSESDGN